MLGEIELLHLVECILASVFLDLYLNVSACTDFSICKSLLNIYSTTSPKYLVIFMFIKLLLSSRLGGIGQNGFQLVGCLDVTFDCCDWLFYVEVYVYVGS